MTLRQILLKTVYPAFTMLGKLSGRRSKVIRNDKRIVPPKSIYDLEIQRNNGEKVKMENFRGKKILFVNTASDCGYTAQYEELEQLYQRFHGSLQVIGFPANDFKEQEKGSDAEIAEFCRVNYGISFPLAKKSSVIKSPAQNAIFQWLSDAGRNGWLNKSPSWNFSKYLVNEQGLLTHYFDPAVSPLGKEIESAINNEKSSAK